jgi:hypothetical protein
MLPVFAAGLATLLGDARPLIGPCLPVRPQRHQCYLDQHAVDCFSGFCQGRADGPVALAYRIAGASDRDPSDGTLHYECHHGKADGAFRVELKPRVEFAWMPGEVAEEPMVITGTVRDDRRTGDTRYEVGGKLVRDDGERFMGYHVYARAPYGFWKVVKPSGRFEVITVWGKGRGMKTWVLRNGRPFTGELVKTRLVNGSEETLRDVYARGEQVGRSGTAPVDIRSLRTGGR